MARNTAPETSAAVDFSRVRAVGLDLDHTLAVYDDQAVNELAFRETAYLLADRGYDTDLLDAPYLDADCCRGLLVSDRGGILQTDSDARPIRAWHGGVWMSADAVRARFGDGPVAPSDGFKLLASPFDIPTGVFAARLSPTHPGTHRPDAALIRTVRTLLDVSHTRGRLKAAILASVSSLVRPIDYVEDIARLRDGGRRLFILTNSDTPYTVGLLDYLFPGVWPDLFDVVATDADKPGFFERGRAAGVVNGLVEHASASDIETLLGVAPDEVLYVGDNPVADTIPARAHGWRTALVVPELAPRTSDPWGDPLHAGGRDTYFKRLIDDSADASATTLADIVHRLTSP